MSWRSCLEWFFIVFLLPTILIQPTSADLMKVELSIGLSIAIDSRTIETRRAGYWFTRVIGDHFDSREIFDYNTLSQYFRFDTESLSFSLASLTDITGGNSDMFAASLNRTNFYRPIVDIGDSSFGGKDSVIFSDFSSLLGKRTSLISDIWY
jgi:hypothetical protein